MKWRELQNRAFYKKSSHRYTNSSEKTEEVKIMEEVIFSQEEDELDCKEIVLQKYFLQEWKIVKSLLDEIVSYGRVPDTSSVHKIRSIVLSHSLTQIYY